MNMPRKIQWMGYYPSVIETVMSSHSNSISDFYFDLKMDVVHVLMFCRGQRSDGRGFYFRFF